MVAFDYKYLPVNELRVVTKEDQKTGKAIVDHLLVHDEPLQQTDRLWVSLQSRFGLGKNIFKLFSHAEVFQRISDTTPNDRLRVCIERDDNGKSRLLGATNPANPVVLYPELMEILEKYDGTNINYSNGMVESTHVPRVASNFDVGGDLFSNRFVMQAPIDGYGMPSTYLSMLRMVCSNGMIGYAPAFRTTLALGKGNDDVRHTLGRTLDGFNNDDGYATMRTRIEASTKSWLSVNESLQLRRTIVKMHNGGMLSVNNDDKALSKAAGLAGWVRGEVQGSPITAAFENMTGDTSRLYGLANLDALSIKRQRTLPVRCTVYDAMNFATEVATHYSKPEGARMLNAWVGSLISNEYDMENTKDRFGDFADFHVVSTLAVPELTGSK